VVHLLAEHRESLAVLQRDVVPSADARQYTPRAVSDLSRSSSSSSSLALR
jgi:hypothetical protein